MSSSASERRAKQTVRNLILSLGATLGVTLLIVLGVPRDDSNRISQVDYVTIANEAEASIGQDLVVPTAPTGWWSNAARLERELGVDSWYVGFVTANNQYLGLSQAWESNPSWEALMLQGNWLEDEVEIAGLKWEIWPALKPSNPPASRDYAMITRFGNNAVVIYGTASKADFELLAEAIAREVSNG